MKAVERFSKKWEENIFLMLLALWLFVLIFNWQYAVGIGVVYQLASISHQLKDIAKRYER